MNNLKTFEEYKFFKGTTKGWDLSKEEPTRSDDWTRGYRPPKKDPNEPFFMGKKKAYMKEKGVEFRKKELADVQQAYDKLKEEYSKKNKELQVILDKLTPDNVFRVQGQKRKGIKILLNDRTRLAVYEGSVGININKPNEKWYNTYWDNWGGYGIRKDDETENLLGEYNELIKRIHRMANKIADTKDIVF